MATAKQEVLKVLHGLPDEVSLEDIQYRLHVLQRVEQGRRDVAQGRIRTQAEVEERMARWLEE